MKYCSTCGAELHDEAVICPKCGCAVPGMKVPNSQSNVEDGEQKKNPMAIVGFIVSFFFGIVGLILGIIALNQTKELDGEGRGLSIAAIIISSVSIVMKIIIFIVVIAGAVAFAAI